MPTWEAGLGAAETRPAGDSRSRFPASGVESEGQPREQMHIHTFVCMCMRAFVFVYKYHVNILAMQCDFTNFHFLNDAQHAFASSQKKKKH